MRAYTDRLKGDPDRLKGDLGKPAPNPIVSKTIRSEIRPYVTFESIYVIRLLCATDLWIFNKLMETLKYLLGIQ